MMSQTDVKEIEDKAVLDVAVNAVSSDVKLAGTVSGLGSTFAVAHLGSNNMITLRYRLKNLKVQAVEKEFKQGTTTFPAGSFIVSGDAGAITSGGAGARAHGDGAADARASVPTYDLDLPRLAVYSTWGSTQDVGWVRYAFDKFEVPFDLIYKDRVRQGDLKSAYDVIVIPHQGGSGKRLVFDIESRGTPIAYKKSEQFKYLGMYGESDDITGGMGVEGVAEFDKFVKSGGVLVTLGTASFFPAEFGLTPKVDAARTTAQFYSPGAIIDAEILQPENPIFYGYDKKIIPVRYANGPLLTVQVPNSFADGPPSGPPPTPKGVLMRWPGGDDHVLSGLMRGANEIRNRPAIVDQPSGKGRVILFAGNPCYRWQNFGEFNMLFNTVLNFNDIRSEPGTPIALTTAPAR